MFQPMEHSLDRLFAHAKGCGYAAVEMWGRGGDFLEVVATAERHQLVIASMGGHQSLELGINDPTQHARIAAELEESLAVAARHRIPSLICLSGNRLPGQSEEQAIADSVVLLKRVAPLAERLGVNLNLEMLNSRIDHPGYQCDSLASALAVIERVASPRVKLLFDIYHVQIMEGDVINRMRACSRHIGHFHTAGNPGRHDLDDGQELNYGAICRAIAETPYAGYVGHEFRPRGEPLAAIAAAFTTCAQG
jgi:hydroxypyruvate isomerase